MKKAITLLFLVVLLTSCSRRVGNIVADTFVGVTVNYQLIGWNKGKNHKLYPVYLRSKVTGTTVNSSDFVKVTLQIALSNNNKQNIKVYWKKELNKGPYGYVTQLIYSGNDYRYDVALNVPYVRGQETISYLMVFAESSPYPIFVSPKITLDG